MSEADIGFTRSVYARDLPDRIAAVVRRAQDVCDRRFSFLGFTFETPDAISWQRCPRTGSEWPRVFHADADYLAPSVPDVKYTWELNRHGFLVDCGMAYRLSGEARFAAEAFRVAGAWIDDNPHLQGINWASGLEVAMRALSWLWTYQLCRPWEGLDAELHERFLGSLAQHGEYLFENLSFYSSPFNHLVGESTLLYLLGSFLTQAEGSSSWRQRGWEVLVGEVEKQFHSDGGSVEQATSYHHFSLGFFLLAVIVRLRRGEQVPAPMWARLEQALEFSMWMTRPDGRVPAIGDADDARSIGFEARAPFDFRNVLCLGAVLFGRGDMKYVAGDEICEDVLWLLGADGADRYRRLAATAPTATSRCFTETGCCIIRGGWDESAHFACFDGGPLGVGVSAGPVASASHGHADLLSFELAPFGIPLIVDPGCSTYDGNLEGHRYFRDVTAHNTVRVDGRSQARFDGRMKWSRAAAPEPLRWTSTPGHQIAVGGHSGFEGMGGRVRHRRAVVGCGDAGLWCVLDRLEGFGSADVEVFFHLSEECGVVEATWSSALCELPSGPLQVLLRCIGPAPLTLEVIEGGREPGGGWIAPSYGRLRRAPILRFHGRLELPASFGFVCAAWRHASTDATAIEPLAETRQDTVACRVRRAGGEEVLRFLWTESGVAVLGADAPIPPASGARVRILEIGPYPPPHGGWSVRIAHLRAAIAGAGHECVVLNIGESRAVPSAEYDGVLSGLDYLRKLRRYASDGYLFHLHINGGSYKGLLLAYAALAVAVASGRRPVLTFHAGTEQSFFPQRKSALATPLFAPLFRTCAAVICNHEGVRKLIVGYGADARNVFSIPAISPQYLAEPPCDLPAAAERFAANRSPIVLAYLKRAPECAPEVVIRALADVAASHPTFGVIVVSPAADVAAMERAFAAAGLAELTCCLSSHDRGEFLGLLRRADVYVRSSNTEGVSSSIAESLLLGTPVVASHGEHPDSVATYEWGDADSLAAVLRATTRDLATARASIRPPVLADTLSEEVGLLIRCAAGGRDRETPV